MLLGLVAAALLTAWQLIAFPAPASARTIRFADREARVPETWPVYRLARNPGMCVRLDRRAVYLGRPSTNQRCPARVIGRRRAILIEPTQDHVAAALPLAAMPGTATPGGLGVFTGLGFDTCAVPSESTMTAWSASPYRAIGIYIGGVNRGCAQPNLTASWVGSQIAAGWHLMPVYVGLQSPTTGCGKCARIKPDQAFAEGAAAGLDAVTQAAALGVGPRSPIYFNMETYDTRIASASVAVLTFLEGWTRKIHSLGYLSGVYASSGSGVVDLVSKLGSGYAEPDQLWFARWDGVANGFDKVIPPTAWIPHRRIHQYRGESVETYGGMTLRIDENYLDAAVVTQGETEPLGHLDLAAAPSPGQVRVSGWAFDPNAPTQPLAVRAHVGGRAGTPGAVKYELGLVATGPRPDVGGLYPEAGPLHGFDLTFPTTKVGNQQICVYAVGIAPGADRLLGCRTARIPVAISLSRVKATATGVQARISCEWPAGVTCQGRLKLRTELAVTTAGSGKAPQSRVVTYWLGRRVYKLAGKHSSLFGVNLDREGQGLLRKHGRLRVQVIATVTGGGRRTTELTLRSSVTR